MGRGPRNPGCGCCNDGCVDFTDTFSGSGSLDAADWSVTGTITQSGGYAEIGTANAEAILTSSAETDQQVRIRIWEMAGGAVGLVYFAYTDSDNHYFLRLTHQSGPVRAELIKRESASNSTIFDDYLAFPAAGYLNEIVVRYDSTDVFVFLWTLPNVSNPIGTGASAWWHADTPSTLGDESGFGSGATVGSTNKLSQYEFGEGTTGQSCWTPSPCHYHFHGDQPVTNWPITGDSSGWTAQTINGLKVWWMTTAARLALTDEPYENNYGHVRYKAPGGVVVSPPFTPSRFRIRFNVVDSSNYHAWEHETRWVGGNLMSGYWRLIKVTTGTESEVFVKDYNSTVGSGSPAVDFEFWWESDGTVEFQGWVFNKTTLPAVTSWHGSGYGFEFSHETGTSAIAELLLCVHDDDPK